MIQRPNRAGMSVAVFEKLATLKTAKYVNEFHDYNIKFDF